jgi:hypothetical protein
MPFYDANLKYLEDEIPPYLNTACLPYMQQYYSIENFDLFRSGVGRRNSYYDYDSYVSALRNDEQRKYLIKFAQKLIQWRHFDYTNRLNLVIRKPVFGEDCRRAVKINLLFQDVFDVKRHKNLDRFSGYDSKQDLDLASAPSAVFNTFALHQEISILPRNIIEDWPEQTPVEIE